MKKFNVLTLALLLLGFSRLSFADGFTARVDRNNVGVNQSFDLKLELTNSRAKTEPDISTVEKSFQILGKEQSSMTNVINGNATSSQVWDISLAPTQMGQLTIPPISIETNQGELKTQPILIQVNQGLAEHRGGRVERGFSFVAKANKTQLYKNEPVIVTFRLTSTRPLQNVQLGDLNIKDAIVEPQGQPKIQRETISGREQIVLTTSYIVTPLKDGVLTVPALVIRAETPAPQAAVSNRRGQLDSFFGDDEDPFAGMQRMMERFTQNADFFGAFGRLQQMSLGSKPITINVLPAIAGVQPWLPATNIRLSESWGGDQSKVGEPITRTLMTDSVGLAASQLPNFDDQLKANDDFKVYSDRPESSTKLAHGKIISSRKDVFTIVPQKAGEMTIPAMNVKWWDTQSHMARVANIPSRAIHVLPRSINLIPATTATGLDKLKTTDPTIQLNTPADSKSYRALVPYGLVSVALILLIFLIRELFLLKKEKLMPSKMSEQKTVKFLGKGDLEKCLTVKEIHQFLQNYCQSKWGMPANSSLSKMFLAAESKLANFDSTKERDLAKRMEEALYADKIIDVDQLRTDIENFIFQKTRNPTKGNSCELLPELNPS